MNKIYAGIGSRNVPDSVTERIFKLSIALAEKGYTLRSGGAEGCDSAFETGCDSVCGKKEIFIPWKNFNVLGGIIATDVETYIEARKLASQFHPGWNFLSEGGKKLHTRNVYQVLGKDLKTLCDFVICYTVDGKASGGTGQAMRIAEHYNIPIYNLFFEQPPDTVMSLIK